MQRPYALLFVLFAIPACSAGGGRPMPMPYPDGRVPPDMDSGPVEFRCEPGTTGCMGNLFYECGPDGRSRSFETQCDDACDPMLRCVACRPGTRRCEGTVSTFCRPDGSGWSPGATARSGGARAAATASAATRAPRPSARARTWAASTGPRRSPTPPSSIAPSSTSAWSSRTRTTWPPTCA
ncbi:MAG: hypothetical protein M5U28_03310 [Sandaracinaceae bacterium]|nr:hypothetical protein [Sandaracinaceae bacterium]